MKCYFQIRYSFCCCTNIRSFLDALAMMFLELRKRQSAVQVLSSCGDGLIWSLCSSQQEVKSRFDFWVHTAAWPIASRAERVKAGGGVCHFCNLPLGGVLDDLESLSGISHVVCQFFFGHLMKSSTAQKKLPDLVDYQDFSFTY